MAAARMGGKSSYDIAHPPALSPGECGVEHLLLDIEDIDAALRPHVPCHLHGVLAKPGPELEDPLALCAPQAPASVARSAFGIASSQRSEYGSGVGSPRLQRRATVSPAAAATTKPTALRGRPRRSVASAASKAAADERPGSSPACA